MNLSFDDIMDVIGTFSFALAGSLAGFIIIVCLRLLALKYNWSLPDWYG